MLAAWVYRYLGRQAAQHARDGLPPLAVYSGDLVGRSISVWGRYERDELALLMATLREHGRLPSDGLALDVGANIGNHTRAFAEQFAHVWAFEPNPRTYALLQFNAVPCSGVRCFNVGLSDRTGSAVLHVPAGNLGMASLGAQAEGEPVRCELRRLDDVIDEAPLPARIALLKLDVEGHEAAVLRGAVELLRRDRPVVLFEQSAEDLRHGESETMALLRQAGYGRWWTFEAPREGPFRVLNLLRRLLRGDELRLVESERLALRFHSLVVALPD